MLFRSRLIENGWLMTKRLNSRNISYVVSPAGMEEIFRRGYHYFKRTIDDVRLYKERIEQLVSEAVAAGYKTIALVSKSDLDFLVEYACKKYKIEFRKTNIDKIDNKEIFILYGEQEEVNKTDKDYWLRTIIMRQK